jgi:DNA-binding transcriptional ArsR family regulator
MNEQTSDIFAALGSPVRLKMAEALMRQGPMAITELGRPHGMSLTGVKKHVSVLEEAGLVRCSKVGRENICAIDPKALQSAASWFERHEKFWMTSFDRLEKLLKRKSQ